MCTDWQRLFQNVVEQELSVMPAKALCPCPITDAPQHWFPYRASRARVHDGNATFGHFLGCRVAINNRFLDAIQKETKKLLFRKLSWIDWHGAEPQIPWKAAQSLIGARLGRARLALSSGSMKPIAMPVNNMRSGGMPMNSPMVLG